MLSDVIAAGGNVTIPDWSRPMFVAGIVAAVIAAVAIGLPVSMSARRWVYWSGWAGAAVLLPLSGIHRGLAQAAAVAVVVAGAGLLIAFYTTPLIKIGGRVRSFWIPNEGRGLTAADVTVPADSYLGSVTAASMWWTLAPLGALTGGYALSTGWFNPVGLAAGALLGLPLALIGHLDKKDELPIARGHYVAFAIIAVSTIPLLLWPVAVYFAAYHLTRPGHPQDA